MLFFYLSYSRLTVLHGETEAEHLKRVQCFCPSAYVMRLFTRKGALLQPSQADAPLPACFVCGGSEITLQVCTELFTLFLLQFLPLKEYHYRKACL